MAVETSAVAGVCSRLLGRRVVAVERLAGGRNSQVFRIDCEAGPPPDCFVAKQYFAVPEDSRDRLRTEFRALEFLKAHGVGNVPSAIAVDPETHTAIYERVAGERATAQSISGADIHSAIDFLLVLRRLSEAGDARSLPAASEACFSMDGIFKSLSGRVARLRSLPDDAMGIAALRRFLDERFDPFVADLTAWAGEQATRHGIERHREIRAEERTLSPSDFGFHNALRDAGGRLVFVDFEYFGWDDPAKTAADFLLHPAMDLSVELKRRFAEGLVSGLPACGQLKQRARVVYPLFGLKWCLILLNEFVPEDLRRRGFAGAADADRSDLLRSQLQRAEQLLDRIAAEYRQNPYFD